MDSGEFPLCSLAVGGDRLRSNAFADLKTNRQIETTEKYGLVLYIVENHRKPRKYRGKP